MISLLATLQVGCATTALDMAPQAPNAPWTPSTNADGEIVAGAASSAGPPTNSFVLPSNARIKAVTPSSPAIDNSHAYTLAELVDIAQSANPQTRIAWQDARNAALSVGITESAYLPWLAASAVGVYQTAQKNATVVGATNGTDTSASGGMGILFLQWLLFDFGEHEAKTAAAKQDSAIANIAFTATHQQVIYRVSLAYYARAAAVARVNAAEKALINANDVQAAAEARYSQGIGTSIEVAQARQATARAQLARVQAVGHLQDAHTGLISAMGISPLTEIRVADIPQRKLSYALTDSIEQFVADSLARRPDVLSAYAAHEASLARLKAAEAEFMPKLFLAGTTSYASVGLNVTSLPAFGGQPSTINVGANRWGGLVMLGVTIPIYDGGTRHALEDQARANAAKTNAQLEQVRDDATREIVVAANSIKTSLSALDAAEVLMAAAQTTFDAALDAYRHGVGSITDVTRAESALLEARNAGTDAYSAALSSAATLALAAGTLGTAPQP